MRRSLLLSITNRQIDFKIIIQPLRHTITGALAQKTLVNLAITFVTFHTQLAVLESFKVTLIISKVIIVVISLRIITIQIVYFVQKLSGLVSFLTKAIHLVRIPIISPKPIRRFREIHFRATIVQMIISKILLIGLTLTFGWFGLGWLIIRHKF